MLVAQADGPDVASYLPARRVSFSELLGAIDDVFDPHSGVCLRVEATRSDSV